MTPVIICATSEEYFAEPYQPGRILLRGWNGKTGRLLIALPNGDIGGVHVRLPDVQHPEGFPSWEIRKGLTEDGKLQQDITITPSIDCHGENKWHGYLTDGVLREC
jgi:hypothetical protein